METIPLTPVDYVFTGVGSQPITFVFYFSKRIHEYALRKSLNEALDVFPILRSRLKRKSEKDFEYALTRDGYTFDLVESDLPFKDSRKVTDYITPVQSLEGHPLTKIQLTQTPNGSVLGVSLSHALADGFSYFYFLITWASICRGHSFFKPYLDRDVVLSQLKIKAGTIEPDMIYSDCGLFYRDPPRKPLAGHPDIERFFISEETIGSHIEKGKKKHEVFLTKNDVITALLWKKYLPMWNRNEGNTKTYLTCPFDFRRVMPGFPPNYFGCALCFTAASVDQESLGVTTVEDLAVKIRQSVKDDCDGKSSSSTSSAGDDYHQFDTYAS